MLKPSQVAYLLGLCQSDGILLGYTLVWIKNSLLCVLPGPIGFELHELGQLSWVTVYGRVQNVKPVSSYKKKNYNLIQIV